MEMQMSATRLAALIFLAAAANAEASQLVPYGGESVQLGAFRGNAYYSVGQNGYRVVATLAEGEAGLPLRFEATLADQQSFTISVPSTLGAQSESLEISRIGDKLIVSRQVPTN
jgi:hypothetical protein